MTGDVAVPAAQLEVWAAMADHQYRAYLRVLHGREVPGATSSLGDDIREALTDARAETACSPGELYWPTERALEAFPALDGCA